MNNPRVLPRRAMLALLVLSACSATVTPGPTPPALVVEASVSSVNLAQDCPSRAPAEPGSGAARCAAPADGGAGLRDSACGSLCRQSAMQLQLRATGEGAASISIARVRLLDARTGAFLQDLSARAPQVWVDPNGYAAWDGEIDAGQTLRTSHALSVPNWYAITPAREQYSRTYRVEVTLHVDGVARTILSAELMREPEVVT